MKDTTASNQFFQKNHEKADVIILVVDVASLVQQMFSIFHQTFKMKLKRITKNVFITRPPNYMKGRDNTYYLKTYLTDIKIA